MKAARGSAAGGPKGRPRLLCFSPDLVDAPPLIMNNTVSMSLIRTRRTPISPAPLPCDAALIPQVPSRQAIALGWADHTLRGALAGALKKKLGRTITSEKVDGRGRVYTIRD